MYLEKKTDCQRNTEEMALATQLDRVGGERRVSPADRQERALITWPAGGGGV